MIMAFDAYFLNAVIKINNLLPRKNKIRSGFKRSRFNFSESYNNSGVTGGNDS